MDPINQKLNEGEQIDRLGFQGLQIIQNPAKFKFTIDAFLLAAFLRPRSRDNLIDLGTGNGVLPLLIAGQRQISHIYGLEIQPELANMAERSVSLNDLTKKIAISCADFRSLPDSIRLNSFDYVISNPPFFPVGTGIISKNNALASAKFEVNCTLLDLIKTAKKLLKGNGRLALIYPVTRLNELLHNLNEANLIPQRLCFIHPRPRTASNLFLIEARPGAKSGPEVLPPIFIYDAANNYSAEMDQIFHGVMI